MEGDKSKNIVRLSSQPSGVQHKTDDNVRNIQIQNSIKSKISRITESVRSKKYSTTSDQSRYFSASGKKQVYDRDEPEAGNEIMVWGSNNYGQLGVGQSMDGMSFPKPKLCVFQVQLTSVACGNEHTLLLTNTGHVYCMGSNKYGQLGLGKTDFGIKTSPTLLENLNAHNIEKVSSGAYHSFAISKSRKVWAWGCSESGQLGLDIFEDQFEPKRVHFEVHKKIEHSVEHVFAGRNHSIFLTVNNQVLCTGDNSFGQLGLTMTRNTSTPILNSWFDSNEIMQNGEKIEQVACGTSHSLFLSNYGKLYACGTNTSHQLGTKSTNIMSQYPIPVTEIKNRKIQTIGAGDFSACITTRGELLIWGLPGICKMQNNKKRIVVKYEMDNKVANISVKGKNAVLLDDTGKIWKLNIEESELHSQQDERILQVSSVQGREVHNISAGKDFTVAICKNNDVTQIKNLGDMATEQLEVSSHRKIGSDRIGPDYIHRPSPNPISDVKYPSRRIQKTREIVTQQSGNGSQNIFHKGHHHHQVQERPVGLNGRSSSTKYMTRNSTGEKIQIRANTSSIDRNSIANQNYHQQRQGRHIMRNESSNRVVVNRSVDSSAPYQGQQNRIQRVVVQQRNPNVRQNSVETVKLLNSGIKHSKIYRSPATKQGHLQGEYRLMDTREFNNMNSVNQSLQNSLEKAYLEEKARQCNGKESNLMKYSQSNSKTQNNLGSTTKLMTSTNFITNSRNPGFSGERSRLSPTPSKFNQVHRIQNHQHDSGYKLVIGNQGHNHGESKTMASRITELLKIVKQQENRIKGLESENSNLKLDNRNLKQKVAFGCLNCNNNSKNRTLAQSVDLDGTYKTYSMPKSTHKPSERLSHPMEQSRMNQKLNQIDQLQNDYSKLGDKLMVYMEKISKLKNDKSKLRSKTKQAEKNLKEAQTALNQLSSDLEVNSKVVKDLEAFNARMKIKVDRLEQDKQKLEKELDIEQSKVANITKNYKNLSTNLDELQNSHDHSMRKITETLNITSSENSQLRNTNQSMKQANKILERENKRLEQQLENKVSRFDQLIVDHREKEIKFRENERELKQENVNLRNEIRTVKNDLSMSQSQAKGLESQVRVWKTKSETLSNLKNSQSLQNFNSRNTHLEGSYRSGTDIQSRRLMKKSSANEIVVEENIISSQQAPGLNVRHSVTPIKQSNFRSTSNLSNSTLQNVPNQYNSLQPDRKSVGMSQTHGSQIFKKPAVKIYGEIQNRREESRSKSPTYVQMKVSTSIQANHNGQYVSNNPQVVKVSEQSYAKQKRESNKSNLSKHTRSSRDESQYMLKTQTQFSDDQGDEAANHMNSSAHIREQSLEFTKGARNLLNILANTNEKDDHMKNTLISQASEQVTHQTEDTYFDRVREIAQNIQRSPASMKKPHSREKSPFNDPNCPDRNFAGELNFKEDELEGKINSTKKRKQLLEEKIAEFENKILNTNRDEEDDSEEDED